MKQEPRLLLLCKSKMKCGSVKKNMELAGNELAVALRIFSINLGLINNPTMQQLRAQCEEILIINNLLNHVGEFPFIVPLYPFTSHAQQGLKGLGEEIVETINGYFDDPLREHLRPAVVQILTTILNEPVVVLLNIPQEQEEHPEIEEEEEEIMINFNNLNGDGEEQEIENQNGIHNLDGFGFD